MRGDQKRVLFRIKTILFLVILIGLSVWQYQNTYIGQDDGAQERHGFYQEYICQLAPLTKEERAAQLEALTTELEESIETGMAQEKVDDQMMSALFQRQSALTMVQEQSDYIDGYQEYLDKVQSDASYIQKGGIFGSADGYPAKNAAKTASDYEKMNAVAERICLAPVYSFETIVQGDLTGLLAAIFTLYLSVCLVRFQKCGLWDMVYASKKGRTCFFLGQIAVLFWGSVGSVCVLYGARVAAELLLFGESSSWNLPVQCSALFESCTLPVSIWQMIALIFVFHIAAAFASALASWFFCILICQEKIAVLLCLGIAVVESVLYRSIAASSNLVLLRVFNLAALWNIQEIMYGYQNVPIGTIPVGQYTSYIVYISVLILACAGAGILLGSRRHPKGAASLSERLMELIGKAASQFAGVFPPIFSEWRKLLFFEHGFLLLLLFGWFVYTIFGGKSVLYMYSDSGIKDGIYSQIEGMEIQDAASWMDEKIRANNSDLAELTQAQEDYDNKKIGYEEWDSIRQKYRNASLYAVAYEDIRTELVRTQQLSEKTNRTIHVVSPFGAKELAGKLNRLEAFDNAKYQKRLLWCFYELIILVFLFAGVFSHENKTKMTRILAASPKGRRILNRRKGRMVRWTVVLLWMTGSIMQFRQIIISGGSFHGLLEPAAAVDVFAALPVWIPFGAALAGVCLLRLLLLLSICGILMGIGSKCKSTAQAAAAGAVLVLVPSGLEYLFSLRFFPLSMLDAVQNLWEKPSIMLIESIIFIAIGVMGYWWAVYNRDSCK